MKAWIKHKPDLVKCLEAIERQKKEKDELVRSGKFCPEWKHPATWLNKGCWEDEVSATDNPYETFAKEWKEEHHEMH